MDAVCFEQCGEPADVLSLQQVPDVVAGPGEVLVRMLASPVNPSDLMYIRGQYTIAADLPARPGFEGVGVVTASGGGLLGSLMKGRRVAVLNRAGGNWAELATVPARQVIPLDKRLTVDQAATFFVNPATAYVMTRELLQVPRDAWLVQTAAASNLGRMVIRLGRHFGFRTLNVVRSAAQVDLLKSLGADEVITFDAETDNPQVLSDSIRSKLGNDGIRYAIDAVGGITGSTLADQLGLHGRLVVYGTLSNQPLNFSSRSLMTVGGQVEGFWLGQYMEQQSLFTKMSLIRKITGLILAGLLETDTVETFPLTDFAAAIELAEQRARKSKPVLRIDAQQ